MAGKAFMDWLSWQLLFKYKIGLKLDSWDQKLLQVFSAFIHSCEFTYLKFTSFRGCSSALPFLAHTVAVWSWFWYILGSDVHRIFFGPALMFPNAKTFIVWWRSCPIYKLFPQRIMFWFVKSHMSELYKLISYRATVYETLSHFIYTQWWLTSDP